MEDLTLPSVGGASKNGGAIHPFSQNARKFLITPKINKSKIKKLKKTRAAV
jgi:hypothetical protein